MLIRSAGPVAQYLVAETLEAHFQVPGRSRENRPARLVHHDDPTSTANRLVSGDLLHFESLSDVVRGGFLGEIVEHILSQPRSQILQDVTVVGGVGTGLAALTRNAPVSIYAGLVGGQIQM